MGRSPELATVKVRLLRPLLSSISPSLMKYSPGIMDVAFVTQGKSSDRLVHGDELGAIGKRRLDLNFRNHFGDAVHHLRAGDDIGAALHEFGDAVAVARALENEIGNQRNRFRMVELDAALKAPA